VLDVSETEGVNVLLNSVISTVYNIFTRRGVRETKITGLVRMIGFISTLVTSSVNHI
jgi:hypothetical protein